MPDKDWDLERLKGRAQRIDFLTDALRLIIKNQNGATRTNSAWVDSPVASQEMEELVRMSYACTDPVMHQGKTVVSHQTMATAYMASCLETIFEDEFEAVLEGHEEDLPMWLKAIVTKALGLIDFADLAETWTAHPEDYLSDNDDVEGS